MALPRIEAAEPVVIDAVPTTYADLYLRKLNVKAVPGSPWSLGAMFLPYDYDTDTLQPNGSPTNLSVGDLKAKATQYPGTVGVMLGSLIALLPLLLREQQLTRQLEEAPEDETLLAALATVQAQLVGE